MSRNDPKIFTVLDAVRARQTLSYFSRRDMAETPAQHWQRLWDEQPFRQQEIRDLKRLQSLSSAVPDTPLEFQELNWKLYDHDYNQRFVIHTPVQPVKKWSYFPLPKEEEKFSLQLYTTEQPPGTALELKTALPFLLGNERVYATMHAEMPGQPRMSIAQAARVLAQHLLLPCIRTYRDSYQEVSPEQAFDLSPWLHQDENLIVARAITATMSLKGTKKLNLYVVLLHKPWLFPKEVRQTHFVSEVTRIPSIEPVRDSYSWSEDKLSHPRYRFQALPWYLMEATRKETPVKPVGTSVTSRQTAGAEGGPYPGQTVFLQRRKTCRDVMKDLTVTT